MIEAKIIKYLSDIFEEFTILKKKKGDYTFIIFPSSPKDKKLTNNIHASDPDFSKALNKLIEKIDPVLKTNEKKNLKNIIHR